MSAATVDARIDAVVAGLMEAILHPLTAEVFDAATRALAAAGATRFGLARVAREILGLHERQLVTAPLAAELMDDPDSPEASGPWQPAEGGTVVTPVPLFAWHLDQLQCVEILALDAARPDRVWRRTGLVPVLGEGAVTAVEYLAAEDRPVRLRLFRHVADWLAAGAPLIVSEAGPGACILDIDSDAASRVLASPLGLVCDDAGHAAEVDHAIQRLKRARRREWPRLFLAKRSAA
jgi:hypothetical protein